MRRSMGRYAATVAAVAVSTVATFALRAWLGPSVSLLFFPSVIISAIYFGYGPGFLATALSTASIAYFFLEPAYSFNIGVDDVARLAAFAAMAALTASISSARKRAEDALRGSLTDLHAVNSALRKVGEWPVRLDLNAADTMRDILEYASRVVGSSETLVVWEAHEEPWIYAADPACAEVISRHPPTDTNPIVKNLLESQPSRLDRTAAVSFHTEHLSGRVFFVGMNDLTARQIPTSELVAREIGVSLDQMHVAQQMRSLAVREERIRLARDLHDGVLQALTGVRLQLQDLADQNGEAPVREHLIGIERAIASEQRELRLFIDNVKPAERIQGSEGVAHGLEDMRRRLGMEWKTPITIRVSPPTAALSPEGYRVLRLMIHEAVINALKHAHPSRVSVDVTADDGQPVRVLVSNDGRGFPFLGRLDHEALLQSHAGPRSLRDRVVALGGTMAVESAPDGACVEIRLPVEMQA